MRRFLPVWFSSSLRPALYYAQAGAPPVARNVVVTTQEGIGKSGALLASDADGGALTFSIVTPPTKGTLDDRRCDDRRLHLHAERRRGGI